jgi:hypothetical protein
MRRPSRLIVALFALALAAPAAAQTAIAQTKVKTETVPTPKGAALAKAQKAAKAQTPPEIVRDLSRLPDKVRQTRERILEAAKSGDPNRVVTVMQANEVMPVFSFGGDKDPLAFWKTSYPDSEGIEALAILIEVLESPYVLLDKGTAQEMYVWPYFYGMPLEKLTPEQKVELFRLITGSDWKEMQEFGAYIFYRVGIGPDGVWHFFVAGD